MKVAMMKPLFFPFTILTENDSEILSGLFPQSMFLSTESEKELADSERICLKKNVQPEEGALQDHDCAGKESAAHKCSCSPFVPLVLSPEELEPVLGSIASYRDWASLHQDSGGCLSSILRDTPYFTSDTDIGSIRSQIEKGGSDLQPGLSPGSVSTPRNPLFSSLLFLRLAHISDLEHEFLDRELSSIDRSENILFSGMQGVENESRELPGPGQGAPVESDRSNRHFRDRGAVMTEQRMWAWSMLLKSKIERYSSLEHLDAPLGHPEPADKVLEEEEFFHRGFNDLADSLWVTTSPAVIDFLISVSEKSKLALDIDNFKVHKDSCSCRDQWQEDFYRSVKTVINGGNWNMDSSIPADGCCDIFADVKIYLFSGKSTKKIFCLSQQEETDSELFQGSGETIPVLLAGLKK